MLKIVLATKNKGKIEEIKYIFKESGIKEAVEIHPLSDYPDIPEISEDGTTFAENAEKKAVTVARATGLTAIADDSGLEVDALNGAPGIYSARFAGEGVSDSENIRKLLRLLEGVPMEKRGARFVCVIAIAMPDENQGDRNVAPIRNIYQDRRGFLTPPEGFSSANVTLMEGECRGIISEVERGTSGFGYDPVFIVPGYGKTFAELGEEIKNKISHRAIALGKLKTHLKQKI